MKFNLLKVVFKAVWHALLALAMDFFCYVTYRQTHFASCILLKILVLQRNEAVWSHYVVGCYQQESRKTFCFTHAYHLTFPTSWSHGATLVLSPEPSQNGVVRIPFSEWLKGQHWKFFRLHQNFQCATGKCFLVFSDTDVSVGGRISLTWASVAGSRGLREIVFLAGHNDFRPVCLYGAMLRLQGCPAFSHTEFKTMRTSLTAPATILPCLTGMMAIRYRYLLFLWWDL